MSVKSKLTAIADAIRTKSGGTDALTLDGMAEAIAALADGVELPTGVLEISVGNWVTTTAKSGVEIEHGLAGKPSGFAIFTNQVSQPSADYLVCALGSNKSYYNYTNGTKHNSVVLVQSCGTMTRWTDGYGADNTVFKLYNPDKPSTQTVTLQPVKIYTWIAWRTTS